MKKQTNKQTPCKRKSRAGWLHWGILPNRQRTYANLSQTLSRIEEEGTLPKSFYEAIITLVPRLIKDTTKKKNCSSNPLAHTIFFISPLSHVWLLQCHGLYPVRLLCPWDFPGKKTGVGCHFILQVIFQPRGQTHIMLPLITYSVISRTHQYLNWQETISAWAFIILGPRVLWNTPMRSKRWAQKSDFI